MDELAKQLKEEGNQCFREKRYNKAIHLYTNSLEKSVDPIVLGNRAQAFINLKHYEYALMDCNRALELDPNFVKALYRRAVTLDALGLYSQARKDCERLLKISHDIATRKLLDRTKNLTNKLSIDVSVVEKGDEIRAEKPLQLIAIECDEKLDELPTTRNTEYKVPQTLTDLPVSRIPPTTYADFLVDFSVLSRYPSLFAEYFLKINTDLYHSIFDEVLDSEVVSCLLKGLALSLDEKNTHTSVSSIVQALFLLPAVSRFDMILLFLTAEDKKNLHRIFDFLPRTDADSIALNFLL